MVAKRCNSCAGLVKNSRGLSGWHRLTSHVQNRCGRVGRLLFAQTIQRGIGFDRGRIYCLGVAGDQPGGHALGKDMDEQAPEDVGREELPGAAHGRVPGHFLVHFVAQEIVNF